MSEVATSAPPKAPERQDSGPGAIIRLALGVAAVIAVAAIFHGLPVLLVVAALVVMVMIHELGHFVAAKLSGMKVTEYFFGFGPRIWSFRRGETEYGVKALPLGGYVRIVGMTGLEEVDPADEPRSYRQATFPRRFLVAIAGSAMHFVMAFGLLWGIVAFTGVPTATPSFEVTGLTSFANHSNPAEAAGVRPGDVIVSVDGHHYKKYTQLVSFIEDHTGQELSLTVKRHSRDITLHVRPIDGRHVEVAGTDQPAKAGKHPVGVIGVELQSVEVLKTTGVLTAVPHAGTLLGRVVGATGEGFAQVFSPHGLSNFVHNVVTAHSNTTSSNSSPTQQQKSQSELLSLPGAVDIAVQGLHQNVSELLYILVFIDIFVGIANLFPMLPLDGGHVAIAVYERIRSRRGRPYHADVTKLMPLAYLFLACLVLLGLGALYVNILQPPSLPHG